MNYRKKTKNSDSNDDSTNIPGEWVKELFAPIYDFDAIVSAGRDGYCGIGSKIRRAPILDPQSIREVFERVHERVLQSEKVKKEEFDQSQQKAEDEKIDPRKSAIWNTDDLETLRKVYKSAKGEISKLESALKEEKSHCMQLESQVQSQLKEIDELRSRVSDVAKANQRLVIHRDNLQKQNTVLDLKCAALSDSWIEIAKEKQKAMETMTEANKQLNEERLMRKKLEADICEVRQNLIRETSLIERNITTKCEIEMNDLNEVIRDLTVQLNEERKLHKATRHGLDHLRKHFSSLPLREVMPPGAVLDDQVDRIDHCSL